MYSIDFTKAKTNFQHLHYNDDGDEMKEIVLNGDVFDFFS